jgi:hypothetical protein
MLAFGGKYVLKILTPIRLPKELYFEKFKFFSIKLLSAIERVGESKRLIGFTCGNLYVITPFIAFKVSF